MDDSKKKLRKKLRKKHGEEWRDLYRLEEIQSQTFFENHRMTYEKLETEQERAVMLQTYTQQILQLKEIYRGKRERLRSSQASQLEDLSNSVDTKEKMTKAKKIKYARIIINVATKMAYLPLAIV